MQRKISSFFKLSPKRDPPPLSQDDAVPDDGLGLWESTRNSFPCTYKRRSPSRRSDGAVGSGSGSGRGAGAGAGAGKVLNKKRSYAQVFLELGQSDFNLRACSICGIKYSPGDDIDEKHHGTFHKNYTQGIPFKGSRNERVVDMPGEQGARVVVVSDCGPLALRTKMQEVIRMMEIELGDGWILRSSCKVYMFISFKRVAGCLVAEPITEAFKVISSQGDPKFACPSKREPGSNSATLKFGGIVFKRETTKKLQPVSSADAADESFNGATVCEEEAVPAACGVRAIWVTPSNRRKHIASQLLDAARRSFCEGIVLQKADLGFSVPTSSGKALASRYTGTASFLVYKSD